MILKKAGSEHEFST